MTMNGQGKSSDILPDERESIPIVEEFGVRSKEIADELARGGSVVEFVGPEVALGVSRQDIRRRIKRWLFNQLWVWWWGLCGTQRQDGELISRPFLGAKARFLSFNRTKYRAVTGPLTVHNILFKIVRSKTESKEVTDGSNFSGVQTANVARNSVRKVCNYLDVRRDFWRHMVADTIINRVQSSRITSLRNYNTVPSLHSSELTQCDRYKGWICLESLQSLEIRTTALDWIMLLLSVLTERILTEGAGNCLGWRDAIQIGRYVYVSAPSWYMRNKTTQRHMLQYSNLHSHCTTPDLDF